MVTTSSYQIRLTAADTIEVSPAMESVAPILLRDEVVAVLHDTGERTEVCLTQEGVHSDVSPQDLARSVAATILQNKAQPIIISKWFSESEF